MDRQKLEVILTRRFPGSSHNQIAAAANAIIGLSQDKEEAFRQDRERLFRDRERDLDDGPA